MHKVTGLSEFQAPDGNFFVFAWSEKTNPTINKDGKEAIQGADYVNVNAGDDTLYIVKVDDNNTTYQVSDGKNFSITLTFADVTLESVEETIHDSWQEIFASIDDGTYSTKYSIGDTKFIDLGSEGHNAMQIVALDTDEKADGSGKAAITWISEQLLNTSRSMNPAYSAGVEGTGSLGGYHKTEMYEYIQKILKPLFPAEVLKGIKSCTKYTREYNVAGDVVNNVESEEDIWLASRHEIFSTTSNAETMGPVYTTAFPDNASCIKKKADETSASRWWLRSAHTNNAFGAVDTTGASGNRGVTSSCGVVLGFCT